jgi:hypothetical protein
MSNQENLRPQPGDSDQQLSSKIDCPTLLDQIWKRQLRSRQIASETAYAKRHSLEMRFGAKFFSQKLVDRSNYTNQVA